MRPPRKRIGTVSSSMMWWTRSSACRARGSPPARKTSPVIPSGPGARAARMDDICAITSSTVGLKLWT
eukprot:9328843-Heterocapsa_arctica.AAC.1